MAKKGSSPLHFPGTIILALGILWFLFVFVTEAVVATAQYVGWVAGCILSFGLFCGSFSFDWTRLLQGFVLPGAGIVIGLVLRRVR